MEGSTGEPLLNADGKPPAGQRFPFGVDGELVTLAATCSSMACLGTLGGLHMPVVHAAQNEAVCSQQCLGESAPSAAAAAGLPASVPLGRLCGHQCQQALQAGNCPKTAGA
jgi:hypothetical protein